MLSACSSYLNDFDCAVGEGMRCASLSKVNKAIDRGEIDLNEEAPAGGPLAENTPAESTPAESILAEDTLAQGAPAQGIPQRSPPQGIVTVWVAPSLDESGHLQASQWVRF